MLLLLNNFLKKINCLYLTNKITANCCSKIVFNVVVGSISGYNIINEALCVVSFYVFKYFFTVSGVTLC